MSQTADTAAPSGRLSDTERVAIAVLAVLVVAAGATRYIPGSPVVLAFVVCALALAGLAWLVSLATEQLGEHLSPALTGTLQATVGNLPEFFVVIFALQAGAIVVAETAILGSIFVNALFVLGLVLIAGALRTPNRVMRFSRGLPTDASTLLMVSAFMIALLGVADFSHDPAGNHERTISIVGAIAILIVYLTWVAGQLRSERRGGGAGLPGQPRLSLGLSAGLLLAAGVGSAFVSEWFVHSLEPTIHQLGISQAFAGLVIVATAGNAVEHLAGVHLAWRGHPDLAISVVKSSVAQVAAFLYPVLVLVSLLTATHLTFALRPEYVGALVVTAILVWQITGDGEATPFEGAALVALFVVLATVAWFET